MTNFSISRSAYRCECNDRCLKKLRNWNSNAAVVVIYHASRVYDRIIVNSGMWITHLQARKSHVGSYSVWLAISNHLLLGFHPGQIKCPSYCILRMRASDTASGHCQLLTFPFDTFADCCKLVNLQ